VVCVGESCSGNSSGLVSISVGGFFCTDVLYLDRIICTLHTQRKYMHSRVFIVFVYLFTGLVCEPELFTFLNNKNALSK